jgi:hypothetical protein
MDELDHNGTGWTQAAFETFLELVPVELRTAIETTIGSNHPEDAQFGELLRAGLEELGTILSLPSSKRARYTAPLEVTPSREIANTAVAPAPAPVISVPPPAPTPAVRKPAIVRPVFLTINSQAKGRKYIPLRGQKTSKPPTPVTQPQELAQALASMEESLKMIDDDSHLDTVLCLVGEIDNPDKCVFHRLGKHNNPECHLPWDKRLKAIRELGLCFQCLKSGHNKANCPDKGTKCVLCQREGHVAPICLTWKEKLTANSTPATTTAAPIAETPSAPDEEGSNSAPETLSEDEEMLVTVEKLSQFFQSQ